MSFIHNSALAGAGGQGGVYEIEQSLRFDGSGPSRLTYDNTSGTNNSSSAWTLSFWMKRGSDIVTSQYGNDLHLMMWTPSGSCANTEYFLIADPQHGTTAIQNCMSFRGGGYSGNAINKLRDPSAWYHFVWRGNTGSSTNIIYINGKPVTAYNQGPSSMTSALVNGATRWSIGDSYTGCSSSPWDGYLAEVHFVDGQTLDHEDFGEFDDNGVWRPIRYTGTYGTNGYYLKFDPSATNGVGHDHSGNGHHWTASNVTTSGTGTDVMDDTPTTNYATFNPLEKTSQGGITNGNLEITASSNLIYRHATIYVPSSSTTKFYWEVKYEGGPNYGIGIKRHIPGSTEYGDTMRLDESNGGNASMAGTGIFSSFTTVTAPTTTTTAGDVFGVAYDPSAGTIKWTKNGSTFAEASGLASADVVPFVGRVSSSGAQTSKFIINFGQRAFEYTPPTGFDNGLNTANLPAPDIADGSQNMMPVLWTGTGSARTQGGYNFQPDLLWIMRRDASGMSVRLHDVVRGDNGTVMYRLQTNAANSEDTDTDVTGLTSTGFTIGKRWFRSPKYS